MALHQCLACVAAKAADETSTPIPASATFLNAIAFAQVFGMESLTRALCPSHEEHLRRYREIAERRARSMD
jgi:hypothetical protein